MLSHYHEAAYDAYMTGYSFANIVKFKETDKGKPAKTPANSSGSKAGSAKVEDFKQEEPAATPRIRYDHSFIQKYLNKVMLSSYTMEFYNLDPTKQGEDEAAEKDYSKIVWVQMDDSIDETADKLAQRMTEFGDFNVFKDSQASLFMEFYFIEPDVVPSQTIEELIELALRPDVAKRLGIRAIVPYKEATKFKAHNRLEQ